MTGDPFEVAATVEGVVLTVRGPYGERVTVDLTHTEALRLATEALQASITANIWEKQ